jgi:hypothetical protein
MRQDNIASSLTETITVQYKAWRYSYLGKHESIFRNIVWQLFCVIVDEDWFDAPNPVDDSQQISMSDNTSFPGKRCFLWADLKCVITT